MPAPLLVPLACMVASLKKNVLKVLAWSERYIKTDMVYLGKSGFWLGLGQFVSSLSAFILSLAFANLLPPSTFGTYKFVLSLASIIAIPTLGGLNTALIRAVAEGHDATTNVVTRLKLQGGFIAFIFGISMAAYYAVQGNATLAAALFIVAAFVPFMELGGLYSAILSGKKQFARLARYDTLLYGTVTIALCAVLLVSDNLFILLGTYFGTWTAGRMWTLYRIKSGYIRTETISSESISLGKHLSAINVLGTLAANLDRVILFHFLGPISVAIYSIAIAPVYQLKGLAKLVTPLSLPKFAAHVSAISVRQYLQKLSLFTAAALLAALLYWICAPFLFSLFFPHYEGVVFYSRILAVAVAFSGYALNNTLLVAYNAKRQIYIQTIVFSTLEIALILVGARWWGIIGVAAAFILGQFFYFAGSTLQVLFVLSKKH